MKKLLLTALILAFAGSAYAGTGVAGSKHDIPAGYNSLNVIAEATALDGRGITGNRICGYCHTPHHADLSDDAILQGLPLWSRAQTTLGSYTNYQSYTIDGSKWDDGYGDAMIGSSWLCLSCHDGTVAVDQHYNFNEASGALLNNDSYGQAGVGALGKLDNDHPIGVDMVKAYTAELQDIDGAGTMESGLNDPSSAKFIDNPLLGSFTIDNYLFEGKYVTCSSCHDVHNKDSVGTEGYMVYSSVAGSKICLSCHNK